MPMNLALYLQDDWEINNKLKLELWFTVQQLPAGGPYTQRYTTDARWK